MKPPAKKPKFSTRRITRRVVSSYKDAGKSLKPPKPLKRY